MIFIGKSPSWRITRQNPNGRHPMGVKLPICFGDLDATAGESPLFKMKVVIQCLQRMDGFEAPRSHLFVRTKSFFDCFCETIDSDELGPTLSYVHSMVRKLDTSLAELDSGSGPCPSDIEKTYRIFCLLLIKRAKIKELKLDASSYWAHCMGPSVHGTQSGELPIGNLVTGAVRPVVSLTLRTEVHISMRSATTFVVCSVHGTDRRPMTLWDIWCNNNNAAMRLRTCGLGSRNFEEFFSLAFLFKQPFVCAQNAVVWSPPGRFLTPCVIPGHVTIVHGNPKKTLSKGHAHLIPASATTGLYYDELSESVFGAIERDESISEILTPAVYNKMLVDAFSLRADAEPDEFVNPLLVLLSDEMESPTNSRFLPIVKIIVPRKHVVECLILCAHRERLEQITLIALKSSGFKNVDVKVELTADKESISFNLTIFAEEGASLTNEAGLSLCEDLEETYGKVTPIDSGFVVKQIGLTVKYNRTPPKRSLEEVKRGVVKPEAGAEMPAYINFHTNSLFTPTGGRKPLVTFGVLHPFGVNLPPSLAGNKAGAHFCQKTFSQARSDSVSFMPVPMTAWSRVAEELVRRDVLKVLWNKSVRKTQTPVYGANGSTVNRHLDELCGEQKPGSPLIISCFNTGAHMGEMDARDEANFATEPEHRNIVGASESKKLLATFFRRTSLWGKVLWIGEPIRIAGEQFENAGRSMSGYSLSNDLRITPSRSINKMLIKSGYTSGDTYTAPYPCGVLSGPYSTLTGLITTAAEGLLTLYKFLFVAVPYLDPSGMDGAEHFIRRLVSRVHAVDPAIRCSLVSMYMCEYCDDYTVNSKDRCVSSNPRCKHNKNAGDRSGADMSRLRSKYSHDLSLGTFDRHTGLFTGGALEAMSRYGGMRPAELGILGTLKSSMIIVFEKANGQQPLDLLDPTNYQLSSAIDSGWAYRLNGRKVSSPDLLLPDQMRIVALGEGIDISAESIDGNLEVRNPFTVDEGFAGIVVIDKSCNCERLSDFMRDGERRITFWAGVHQNLNVPGRGSTRCTFASSRSQIGRLQIRVELTTFSMKRGKRMKMPCQAVFEICTVCLKSLTSLKQCKCLSEEGGYGRRRNLYETIDAISTGNHFDPQICIKRRPSDPFKHFLCNKMVPVAWPLNPADPAMDTLANARPAGSSYRQLTDIGSAQAVDAQGDFGMVHFANELPFYGVTTLTENIEGADALIIPFLGNENATVWMRADCDGYVDLRTGCMVIMPRRFVKGQLDLIRGSIDRTGHLPKAADYREQKRIFGAPVKCIFIVPHSNHIQQVLTLPVHPLRFIVASAAAGEMKRDAVKRVQGAKPDVMFASEEVTEKGVPIFVVTLKHIGRRMRVPDVEEQLRIIKTLERNVPRREMFNEVYVDGEATASICGGTDSTKFGAVGQGCVCNYFASRNLLKVRERYRHYCIICKAHTIDDNDVCHCQGCEYHEGEVCPHYSVEPRELGDLMAVRPPDFQQAAGAMTFKCDLSKPKPAIKPKPKMKGFRRSFQPLSPELAAGPTRWGAAQVEDEIAKKDVLVIARHQDLKKGVDRGVAAHIAKCKKLRKNMMAHELERMRIRNSKMDVSKFEAVECHCDPEKVKTVKPIVPVTPISVIYTHPDFVSRQVDVPEDIRNVVPPSVQKVSNTKSMSIQDGISYIFQLTSAHQRCPSDVNLWKTCEFNGGVEVLGRTRHEDLKNGYQVMFGKFTVTRKVTIDTETTVGRVATGRTVEVSGTAAEQMMFGMHDDRGGMATKTSKETRHQIASSTRTTDEQVTFTKLIVATVTTGSCSGAIDADFTWEDLKLCGVLIPVRRVVEGGISKMITTAVSGNRSRLINIRKGKVTRSFVMRLSREPFKFNLDSAIEHFTTGYRGHSILRVVNVDNQDLLMASASRERYPRSYSLVEIARAKVALERKWRPQRGCDDTSRADGNQSRFRETHKWFTKSYKSRNNSDVFNALKDLGCEPTLAEARLDLLSQDCDCSIDQWNALLKMGVCRGSPLGILKGSLPICWAHLARAVNYPSPPVKDILCRDGETRTVGTVTKLVANELGFAAVGEFRKPIGRDTVECTLCGARGHNEEEHRTFASQEQTHTVNQDSLHGAIEAAQSGFTNLYMMYIIGRAAAAALKKTCSLQVYSRDVRVSSDFLSSDYERSCEASKESKIQKGRMGSVDENVILVLSGNSDRSRVDTALREDHLIVARLSNLDSQCFHERLRLRHTRFRLASGEYLWIPKLKVERHGNRVYGKHAKHHCIVKSEEDSQCIICEKEEVVEEEEVQSGSSKFNTVTSRTVFNSHRGKEGTDFTSYFGQPGQRSNNRSDAEEYEPEHNSIFDVEVNKPSSFRKTYHPFILDQSMLLI